MLISSLSDNPSPSESIATTSVVAVTPFHITVIVSPVKTRSWLPVDWSVSITVNVPTKKLDKGENFLSYALLGRIGIFNKFDITFRENSKKLILKSPKTYRNN